MLNEGWKCPGCGSCYAPWKAKCDTCIGDQIKITVNPPGVSIHAECQHIWGPVDTYGVFCTMCGMQQVVWEHGGSND